MNQENRTALLAATRTLMTAKPEPEKRTRTRTVIASDGKSRRGKKSATWPYASNALGVNPDQIEAARNELAKHGVSCEFDPEGRAIVNSQKHFDAIARASGLKTGRDGYEVRDADGQRIHTGRSQVQERERLKQELANGNWQAVEEHFGIESEDYC